MNLLRTDSSCVTLLRVFPTRKSWRTIRIFTRGRACSFLSVVGTGIRFMLFGANPKANQRQRCTLQHTDPIQPNGQTSSGVERNDNQTLYQTRA
jgi:hypothetical protein